MSKSSFYYNKNLLTKNSLILGSGLVALTVLTIIFYVQSKSNFFIFYLLVIYAIFLPGILSSSGVLIRKNCEFVTIEDSNITINTIGISKKQFTVDEINDVTADNNRIKIKYKKNKAFIVRARYMDSYDNFKKLSKTLTQLSRRK
jgi:ATPase involved in DNA replication initiation